MKLSSRVLRVHPEPFHYVDEQTVHEALTSEPERYLDFLEEALARIARGQASIELPTKIIFDDGRDRGDFRVMPCVVRDGPHIVKTVKLVGTNVRQKLVPDQITVGKAFRLDPDENHITHIFEACLLSSARTGACAAVALRRLAERPQRVTVVGAGRVGYYAALYTSLTRSVEEVRVHDTDPERASAMASLLEQSGRPGICCLAATRPDRGPTQTDVLILATTSKMAHCSPSEVSASVVVSLGADAEDQHELTEDWARVAEIYVDTRDSARVGDLRGWLEAGLVRQEGLIDLVGLFRQPPPSPRRRTRLFISTGSALLDNLTIWYLLGRLPKDPP